MQPYRSQGRKARSRGRNCRRRSAGDAGAGDYGGVVGLLDIVLYHTVLCGASSVSPPIPLPKNPPEFPTHNHNLISAIPLKHRSHPHPQFHIQTPCPKPPPLPPPRLSKPSTLMCPPRPTPLRKIRPSASKTRPPAPKPSPPRCRPTIPIPLFPLTPIPKQIRPRSARRSARRRPRPEPGLPIGRSTRLVARRRRVVGRWWIVAAAAAEPGTAVCAWDWGAPCRVCCGGPGRVYDDSQEGEEDGGEEERPPAFCGVLVKGERRGGGGGAQTPASGNISQRRERPAVFLVSRIRKHQPVFNTTGAFTR